MTHLKTLLTGPAKIALAGTGFLGVMYDTAWKTFVRKFSQPHLILGLQLTQIQNYPQLVPYDSGSFVILVEKVVTFVDVLRRFHYSNECSHQVM